MSRDGFEDRSVFFLTILVTTEVYVQSHGWMQVLFKFAFARDTKEAEVLARRYCAENGLVASWVKAARAREQNLARYTCPESILRSRAMAPVWRGQVAVHPEQIPALTGLGATCEDRLGERLFVFSAPEATAMLINSSKAVYVGMLKPQQIAAANDASAAVPTGAGR